MFLILNINRSIKIKSPYVVLQYNKYLIDILNVLWNSKLISGYEINKTIVLVFLKYTRLGIPVLKKIKPISKPSRSYYLNKLNYSKSPFKYNKLYVVCNSKQKYFIGLPKQISGRVLFEVTT